MTYSVCSFTKWYTNRHPLIYSLASGYMQACWFPSPEIGRIVAQRASGIKIPWVHGWAYSHCHLLCDCCRPASGHTVRGVSEGGPAINQGSNPEIGEYKESMHSCPRVLHVSFNCFSGSPCYQTLEVRLGSPGMEGLNCLWGIWGQLGSYIWLMFLRVLVPAHRGQIR